ncbi:MAG: hypothetical protein KAW52_02220, partial [candidate division Zixibacteria bacterium]|nr:hypothetical protein [candidate division Zixibacteria bacterium]
MADLKELCKKLFARRRSISMTKKMNEKDFHVMIGQNFGGSRQKKGDFSSASARKDFPISPVSKRTSYLDQGELLLPQSSLYDSSFRIRLYRFLKDNIPVLNSAVWTWTHICSSPSYFELKGSDENPAHGEDDPKLEDFAFKILKNLDRRVYQHSFQKFGGTDALLMQFFNSLFTDGAVCGELVLTPSRDRLDKFYFIDPATIRFKLRDETSWELYQEVD